MITATQCACCKKYEDDLVDGLCIECEDVGTGNKYDPMAEEYYKYMNPIEHEENFRLMDEDEDEDDIEDIYDPYDYDPYPIGW